MRKEIGSQIRAVPGARRLSLIALALMAIGAWATVSVPRLLGQTVDVVRQVTGEGATVTGPADGNGVDQAGNADTANQWWTFIVDSGLGAIGLKMLVAAMVGGAASAAGYYLMSKVSERVIANLRETMVGTALGLPLHQVEDAGTAGLVSRSTDDVAEVSAAITETLPLLSKSVFLIVATATALVAGPAVIALCTGGGNPILVGSAALPASRAGTLCRRTCRHGRTCAPGARSDPWSGYHPGVPNGKRHARPHCECQLGCCPEGAACPHGAVSPAALDGRGEFLLSASVLIGGFISSVLDG